MAASAPRHGPGSGRSPCRSPARAAARPGQPDNGAGPAGADPAGHAANCRDSHPAGRGARPSASSPRATGDGRNRRSGSRPAEAARCHPARAGDIRTARPLPLAAGRPRRAGRAGAAPAGKAYQRRARPRWGHGPRRYRSAGRHGPAVGRILADEVDPAAAPGAAASTWPGRADDNHMTGASLDGGRDHGGQERAGADDQPGLVRPAEPRAPAPGQHDGGQPGTPAAGSGSGVTAAAAVSRRWPTWAWRAAGSRDR